MMMRRFRSPAPRRVARLAVQGGRLPGGARPHAGPTQQTADALVQPRVARDAQHVLDPGAVQEGEQLGLGEAGIGPHAQPGAGKQRLELGEQPAQQAADPARARAGARTQQGAHHVLHRLGVERHRGDEWQIAPRVVVAVEERELLLAVGRIVRRIEVDRDQADGVAEPLPVERQDRIGDGQAEAIQVGTPDGVLEPRQRRLRAQGRAGEGIAVQQQLVDRIVGQAGGVVAVGVATGQAEHALPHQVAQRMGNLARLPPVAQGARHLRRQRQPVVDQLQQQGTAVGAGVRLIEPSDDRLAIPVDPQRALRYTGCGHRASLRSCDESSCQRSFRTLQRLDGSLLSSFTHNPG
jgi:hypothetical protein